MTPARLGAVSYLNTRPLVVGLEQRPELFTLRFDVPSRCAALLHAGEVELGLIPAIEYGRGREPYRIVPDVAIGANGPIASVALFTRVPVRQITSLALDESSRTSVALTAILCARRWRIAPVLMPLAAPLPSMLQTADAALVIGDPALLQPSLAGVEKIDLGEEWSAWTGLPFVFAFWAGRNAAVDPSQVEALQEARRRGEHSLARIAADYAAGDPAREDLALRYLRDNLKFGLGEAEQHGLSRYLALATAEGLLPSAPALHWYE